MHPDAPRQPQTGDVVLGGETTLPKGAAILGGFAGLKQRLLSPYPQQRSAALGEALQHGPKGVNLVLRALLDPQPAVREVAYHLLKDRTEPKVQQALERYYQRQHYAQLEKLLSTHQWQAADQETRIVMLRALGLEFQQTLRSEQIQQLPCQDLRVIDQLWITYSQGRFGFTVQRAIWRKYDRRFWNKADVWSAFADRVGWRINNLFRENHWKSQRELTFNLTAPVGHLPFLGDACGIFTIEAICDRLDAC